MAVNELIFTQLTFTLQRFAMNSYTEFHENLTNSFVAGNRLQTDVVSTYGFLYVLESLRSLIFPSKKKKYTNELTECI
jgi:hypothetical protein